MFWSALRSSDLHGFGAIDGEKMTELLLLADWVREELDAHEHFFRLKVLVADDRQHDASDSEELLQARLLYVDLGYSVEASVFISCAEGKVEGLFVDRLGVEVDGADPLGLVEAVEEVPEFGEDEQDHDYEDDALSD